MRNSLPVVALALLLAACGAATTTPPSAQQPTAAMAEKPTEAMMEAKPTEAMMEAKPTEAMMEAKPTEAMMEEKPTVSLKYIPGRSDAGPKDATGTLTLIPSSNTIIVDVKGLPPIAGKVFEVWLL